MTEYLAVASGTLAATLVGAYVAYGVIRPAMRRRMERQHHRNKKIRKP